jgi:hypothetical protein
VRQLPLAKVIWGTFAFPWMYRAGWFRAINVPLLALIGVTLLWNSTALIDNVPLEAIAYAAYLAATSWLAVHTHRFVLAGDVASPGESGGALRTVGLYLIAMALVWLLWTLLTSLIALPAVLALMTWHNGGFYTPVSAAQPPPTFDAAIQAQIDWVGYLANIPAAWVVARLLPMLPAIALGRDWRPRTAWQLSRGNGWRLAIATLLIPHLFTLLLGLLSREGAGAFEIAGLAVLLAVLVSLEVVALSLSYRELTAPDPSPRAP